MNIATKKPIPKQNNKCMTDITRYYNLGFLPLSLSLSLRYPFSLSLTFPHFKITVQPCWWELKGGFLKFVCTLHFESSWVESSQILYRMTRHHLLKRVGFEQKKNRNAKRMDKNSAIKFVAKLQNHEIENQNDIFLSFRTNNTKKNKKICERR